VPTGGCSQLSFLLLLLTHVPPPAPPANGLAVRQLPGAPAAGARAQAQEAADGEAAPRAHQPVPGRAQAPARPRRGGSLLTVTIFK